MLKILTTIFLLGTSATSFADSDLADTFNDYLTTKMPFKREGRVGEGTFVYAQPKELYRDQFGDKYCQIVSSSIDDPRCGVVIPFAYDSDKHRLYQIGTDNSGIFGDSPRQLQDTLDNLCQEKNQHRKRNGYYWLPEKVELTIVKEKSLVGASEDDIDVEDIMYSHFNAIINATEKSFDEYEFPQSVTRSPNDIALRRVQEAKFFHLLTVTDITCREVTGKNYDKNRVDIVLVDTKKNKSLAFEMDHSLNNMAFRFRPRFVEEKKTSRTAQNDSSRNRSYVIERIIVNGNQDNSRK